MTTNKIYCVHTKTAKDYSTAKLKSTIRNYCKEENIHYRDTMYTVNRMMCGKINNYGYFLKTDTSFIKNILFSDKTGGILFFISNDEKKVSLAVKELILETGAHIQYKEITEDYFIKGSHNFNTTTLPIIYKSIVKSYQFTRLKNDIGDRDIFDFCSMPKDSIEKVFKKIPKTNYSSYYLQNGVYNTMVDIISQYTEINK